MKWISPFLLTAAVCAAGCGDANAPLDDQVSAGGANSDDNAGLDGPTDEESNGSPDSEEEDGPGEETGGSGGTMETGGSGGTMETGGSGGTMETGGSGGTMETGGSGGTMETGGSGGTMVTPELERLDAGRFHTCALTEEGSTRCWGNNTHGQLGDGTQVTRATPVTVGGLAGATALSCGGFSSCAILSDQTVSCFGLNDEGQLGNGTTVSSTTPVPTSDLDAVTDLSVGEAQACALRPGEKPYCWGLHGTTGDPTLPGLVSVYGVQVGTSISAGNGHFCTVHEDQTVACWDNYYYFLGNTHEIEGAVTVVSGHDHACSLMADQTALCWGDGAAGQLGYGTFDLPRFPVAVTDLTNIVGMTAGNAHTCALLEHGQVYCWGSNSYGQLGDGTTLSRSSPVRVSGIEGAVAVSAGYAHTCARLEDGAVKCWGWNAFSQLGDGTTRSRMVPGRVADLGPEEPAPDPEPSPPSEPSPEPEDEPEELPPWSGVSYNDSATCSSCLATLDECGTAATCAACMDSEKPGCSSNDTYQAVLSCVCGGATRCAALDECTALPPAPRLVGPISPNYQGPQPLLRWELPAAADGARVDLFRDREGLEWVGSWYVVDEVRLETALPPGVYFWSAVGSRQLEDTSWLDGTDRSPTWEFVVGRGTASPVAGYGFLPDTDGDGRTNLLVGNSADSGGAAFETASVSFYRVLSSSSISRTKKIYNDPIYNGSVSGATWAALWQYTGDINGDGYNDAVTVSDFNVRTGRVRLYLGDDDGLKSAGDTILSDTVYNRAKDVAQVGDVDADGYADVAVVVNQTPHQLFLLRGSPSGLIKPETPIALDVSSTPTLHGLGDVDGDGHPDLGVSDLGGKRVFVFLGSASGFAATPDVTLDGIRNVWAVGDVNGDGLADMVLQEYTTASAYVGEPTAAYLLLGGSGWSVGEHNEFTQPQHALPLSLCQDCSGNLDTSKITSAGDLNGDGYGDVLFAGRIDQSPHGRVYVYYGGPDGLTIHRMRELYNEDDMMRIFDTYFGWSLAGLGDLDGDGLDDIAIGARDHGSPSASGRIRPRIRIYSGRSHGMSVDPTLTLQSTGVLHLNDAFGASFGGPGG